MTIFRCLVIAVVLWLATSPEARADRVDAPLSANALFLSTFLTYCMPPAHGDGRYDTSDMTEMDRQQAARFLAGLPGEVWVPHRGRDLVLVITAMGRGCQVLSRQGDADALLAELERVFTDGYSGFSQVAMSRFAGGGFHVSYAAPCPNGRRCLANFTARKDRRAGQPALRGTAAITR